MRAALAYRSLGCASYYCPLLAGCLLALAASSASQAQASSARAQSAARRPGPAQPRASRLAKSKRLYFALGTALSRPSALRRMRASARRAQARARMPSGARLGGPGRPAVGGRDHN